MKFPRTVPTLICPLIFLCAAVPVRADDAPPTTAPATQQSATSQFLRYVEDGAGGGTLQTAVVTYRNADGVRVHLVAAVHVAEPAYYQGLGEMFKDYDALLYEMVKPRGSGVPEPGAKPATAIGMFQHWLKDALRLDFQLDDIDYTQPNFVHADLDYETFSDLQQQRGESMLTIMLQTMLQEMARETQGARKSDNFGLIDLIIVLRAPDRPRQLKLLLAEQFSNIEDQMSGLTGPNGSVIITERNKRAIVVLRDSIASGKKNLGIFFGAAHMGDLSARLKAMGFVREGETRWRVAWDMTTPPSTQPAAESRPAVHQP